MEIFVVVYRQRCWIKAKQYYEINIDIIKSKEYEINKDRLQEKYRDPYSKLSDEKKKRREENIQEINTEI